MTKEEKVNCGSIFVQDINGNPLMPTYDQNKCFGMVRHGKAIIVSRNPLTIKLTYESLKHKQDIDLGLDSGSKFIGFSAVSKKYELISGTVELLSGQSERLKEKKMYKTLRNNKKRYREARFNNRKKNTGQLTAPSVQHKLNAHTKIVKKLLALLPITKINVEIGLFDIQKLKNSLIEGVDYQKGVQFSYSSTKAYVKKRDNYMCQNPNCKHKKEKKSKLTVHHIIFRSQPNSNDTPSNLITLCTRCHTPAAHKSWLLDWKPKLKTYRDASIMNTIAPFIVKELKNIIDNVEVTYGNYTYDKRKELGLEKTHYNDAFVIAGGTTQKRSKPKTVKEVRRNNRSLESFVDAMYIDKRTGLKVKAAVLNCGRTTRNTNLNTENLRVYRGKKTRKGNYRLRKKRPKFQPNDLVIYNGVYYYVKSSVNYGNYIRLHDYNKDVPVNDLVLVRSFKGMCFID
jgi:hypothetical protein